MLGYLLCQILNIVGTVAVPTISYLGIRYLNRRWNLNISLEEQKRITHSAEQAYIFTEQKYRHVEKTAETNKQKLETALNYLMTDLQKTRIKIDKKTAVRSIEAAVGKANMEREKPQSGSEESLEK